MTLRRTAGAIRPDTGLHWTDDEDAVIDFSEGESFSLKVATKPYGTALFTKTTGIEGYGTVPNIVLVWAATGEIGTLSSGSYWAQLRATDGDGRPRVAEFEFEITPRIT